MAGRHTDWTHIRVPEGADRNAAAPYIPVGRKLLGQAIDLAQKGDLSQKKLRRELPDGAVITAEIIGGEPIITIEPPQHFERELPPVFKDDFVVWARDAAHPTGIDADHPQQILRPTWKTYFYDSGIEGYDDFAGEKGTYRVNDNGKETFPDGIKHAGNIDWRSKDGVRLSWHGPSSRYWLDPYIQPQTQYGKKVFMLGQVLLDTDEYIAELDPPAPFDQRYVLGAALVGFSDLYVIQAHLPLGTTLTGTAPPNTIYVNQPQPLDPGDVPAQIPITVSRYKVSNNPSESEVFKYEVVGGSREVLWSGTLENAFAPFFFNEAGSVALSASMPQNSVAVSANGGLLAPPSASSKIHQFNIEEEVANYSFTTVALGVAPSQAACAVDFSGNTMKEIVIRREALDDLPESYGFVMDGITHWMRHVQHLAPGDNTHQRVRTKHVLYADVRTGTAAFLQTDCEVDFPSVLSSAAQFELWHQGVMVKVIAIPFSEVSGGGLARSLATVTYGWITCVAGVSLAPQFPLFALYTGVENGSLSNLLRWQGGHGLYSARPYPAASVFGAYASRRATSGPYVAMSSFNDADAASQPLDFDSKYSVLGCATIGSTVLYSGYAYKGDGSSIFTIGGKGSESTLPQLTGVTSDLARFHPIWLLGKPPANAST